MKSNNDCVHKIKKNHQLSEWVLPLVVFYYFFPFFF